MTHKEGYLEALRRIKEARRTGAIELDLSDLRLTNIPPELKACQSLQTLSLNGNPISQLENLPESLRTLNLNKLMRADFVAEHVSEYGYQFVQEMTLHDRISQIKNLPQGLQTLDLSGNQISQIKNLPGRLQTLNLSDNQISQIKNLPGRLQTLDLSDNQISRIENLPGRLQELKLRGNPTTNIPTELLNNSFNDNCLYNVRAWFANLDKGAELNTTVKFMVSGNSNVGKSSVIEALQTGKAQLNQDSTHGIRIEPLSLRDGIQEVDGIAFDFGGQEIYYGTHHLFLRSRAVQIIVFDADTETMTLAPDRRGTQGETTRNKNLPNWLNDLRRLSPDSAFVMVQNKIEEFIPLSPGTQTLINQLDGQPDVWTARVSAQTGRGIASLRGHLTEAAQSLPEYGMSMPRSWYAVRQHFLQNNQRPVGERQRVVSRNYFNQICTEHRVLPGSELALLFYLHNTGVVYYDEAYINDTIIADQGWAIEAIYEVLDRRGRLYDELTNDSFGKKRLKYLFGYFDAAYTTAERRLFVAMMESCGLCFPLQEEHYEEPNDDTYYLFPQFLPTDRTDSAALFLENSSERVVYQQAVEFLPYYHVQQLIARWGVKTDIRNLRRSGFLVAVPNEGRFLLEADFGANTLMLTAERTISPEMIDQLFQELGYAEAEWQPVGAAPLPASGKGNPNLPAEPLRETLPDVVQPTIRKLVVSFAKEDERYVDLLRQKMAARKTIDLWYDRYLTGWEDPDNQIKQHFMDCDGYIIFLSNKYMDKEMKPYIHKKEIPLMRQRFDANQVKVAVINVSAYETEDTDLGSFLRFKKGTVMPDPKKRLEKADEFLEEFINGSLYKDFPKDSQPSGKSGW